MTVAGAAVKTLGANRDFYPTPKDLAIRMLEKAYANKYPRVILEPSAGKGDLCDYLRDFMENQGRNRALHSSLRLNLDAIEIDQDLRAILKSKDIRVIHDDFLTFETRKCYDLILANFPFSEGDQHLLHALRLLSENGGRLVCLVNAETIENPYTLARQTAVKMLSEFGAQIEILPNTFLAAERKTGVSVALISVDAPEKPRYSFLFEEMKKSAEQEGDASPTAVARIGLSNEMLTAFNLEAEMGIRLIREYFSVRPYISTSGEHPRPLITLEIDDRSFSSETEMINSYLKAIRSKFWALLLRDPRFRSAYTSNILASLETKLGVLSDYDFTEFNIRALKEELKSSVVQGVQDSILKLFDDLSRRFSYGTDFGTNIHLYNGWKTNQAHKINQKVIIPMNGFSAVYGAAQRRLDYRTNDRIEDIIKVFNYLSDSPVKDIKQLVGQSVEEANAASVSQINLTYFSIKFFKKGTAHLVFKDERLLEKFNIYGSQRKGWLPPSYGTKSYAAMDDEERAVIDEFQGRESYEKVMADREYYLGSTDLGRLLAT